MEITRNEFHMKQKFHMRKLEKEMSLTTVKFRKACQQIQLLNNRFTEAETRYMRSMKEESHSWSAAACYSQRISLSAYDGIRSMYHIYAHKMAAKLDELKKEWVTAKKYRFDEENDSAYEGSVNSDDAESDSNN